MRKNRDTMSEILTPDIEEKPSPIFPSSFNFKILMAGVIGNGLEFYDFALFGVFSGVFANIFFQGDDFIALLKSLGLFAAGFIMRPLGSVFFGHIGDRLGRKKALNISITLMGIATFLIGCLPTHEQVGFYAVLGLLLCRLIQGFCLGGENNGSAIFVLEHCKEGYKGLAGALILTGGAMGTLLAMFLGSWVMSPAMPQWGWRIPFWLGLTIALIGLYIRNQLEETPEYKNALQEKRIQKHPLKNMIKNNLKAFIGTIGIGGVNGIFAYTLVVFINLYLNKTVGVSVSNSMFYSCIGLSIFAFLAPVFGLMTDRYGAIRIMKRACLFSFFMSFPLFYLLYENTATSFSFAILLAALMMASFNAPTNYLLNTLFPVQARYSGIALGYAIGAAIFGGTAPLIYTFLLEITKNVYSPSLYLSLASVIGMSSLLFVEKIRIKDDL